MRRIISSISFLLFCASAAGVEGAQESAPAQKTEDIQTPSPETKAAPTKPKSLQAESLEHATQMARAGDFDGAVALAEQLRLRMVASDPFPDELLGSVLTIKKDYVNAEKSYRAMLVKAPNSPIAHFNLAEVIFLQTRYEESEEMFAALEATQSQTDPALADLCRFKRVICLLALRKIQVVEKMMPPPPEKKESSTAPLNEQQEVAPQSPAVMYSQSAIQFFKGQLADANQTIAIARKQFTPETENLFVDSFIEMEWGGRGAEGTFAFAAKK